MQLNAFKRKKAQTFPPIHDKGLKKSVVLAFCARNQQLGLFRNSSWRGVLRLLGNYSVFARISVRRSHGNISESYPSRKKSNASFISSELAV